MDDEDKDEFYDWATRGAVLGATGTLECLWLTWSRMSARFGLATEEWCACLKIVCDVVPPFQAFTGLLETRVKICDSAPSSEFQSLLLSGLECGHLPFVLVVYDDFQDAAAEQNGSTVLFCPKCLGARISQEIAEEGDYIPKGPLS